MSSIAALATRRALTRQPLLRAPPRRFTSSKIEDANLEKGAKKDPELYVRTPDQPLSLTRALKLILATIGPSRCHVWCLPPCRLVNIALPPAPDTRLFPQTILSLGDRSSQFNRTYTLPRGAGDMF